MSEVVDALLSPNAYDEDVTEAIKLLQTHISYVFLTGRYAYKIKKPVDFGFLDFTTLEKRKFYCEEELRVNRRLAEDMYLEVVPINKSRGKIAVKGAGNTVEYAVKMKEFPQECIMTNMLEENKVKGEHIEEIARTLAEFHSRAATGEGVDVYGVLEQVSANWIQNFDQTRHLRGGLIDSGTFDNIEDRVLGFLEREKEVFKGRVAAGKVRECHGDVHSGNIFIVDNRTHIFDAIEFNKAFSCSDVASEIAFLTMDLEFHGRLDFADLVTAMYVKYGGDEGIIELLPFYKCYRAYVRAKVSGFKLQDMGIAGKERRRSEDLIKRYFELALKYANAI
ncbi:MAG: hypothetical protein ACE5G7_00715, partial [Candidatus Hydrothermarchaeaceae archaeon]